MAKLVDAPSSGGGAARCAGSNPVLGTDHKPETLLSFILKRVLIFDLYPKYLTGSNDGYSIFIGSSE